MEINYEKQSGNLIFKINEEIDEYSVQKMRRKLDNEIERYLPQKVIFDFDEVSFMDSAGIGLLIGRYKLANMLGSKVEMRNVSTQVKKIFEMSGILKLIPETSKKEEEVV